MSRARKVIIEESTGLRIIEQSRMRLLCVGLFFILCFGSIAFRMVEVAVLDRHPHTTITVVDPDDENASQEVTVADDQQVFQRGDIVDRNGVLLATSLVTASIFANPKELKQPGEVADKLAKVLRVDAKQLAARLNSNKSFVWLKRNLTPKEQQAVNSLGIPGLYFLPEERRVYPYGHMLAHAIGYVGVDNKGLAGVEKYFDTRLRDPVLGHAPLALSIDVRLQAILREEMQKSVREFQAIGAAGVIMDMHSGELLSMVSLPDFDPHSPAKSSDAARFNRVAQGSYEMGSTFKSFTIANALESGVVTMKSGYDATNPFKVASYTIQDTHPKKRWLSVPEIYAYSSNIGTAKMILDLGGKKHKAFLERMGMMKPVEIELPEKGTPLFPSQWKEINTVTISYGHGISVSPLHLVRGIAALIGEGGFSRLTLLKDGNQDRAVPEPIVSEKTMQNMRRLMRLVVNYGTGAKADVPGYRVGGKTGTAEKVQTGGVYNADAKLASFIATFPIDDPKYIVLVMIDEPKGNKATYGFATGGWIAAPVVGNVISRMGPLLGIKPLYDVPEDDAGKFWVEQKPAPEISPRTSEAKYVRPASY